MKDLPNTETFDDNFSKYSQRFRQLFGMQTDKAIDLFYQTVSMKSVSSLTVFVREQMLERTEIKAQIEDLKKRFDDLNKAYAAVQLARKQKDTLEPLVDFCKNFRVYEERIQDIEGILNAVPAYFASEKIALLETEIAEHERKLLQFAGQLIGIEELLNTKRDNLHQIKQDIRSNGGERLENIAKEIDEKGRIRDVKRGKHNQYTELTSFCELETANTDKTFFRNLKNAEQKVEAFKARQDEILAEIGTIAGSKASLEENIEAESKELESLKQRENQIPLEFLNIRKQLADVLEIDEEEIPFAGELMKVHEQEKDWEGALERLLRGFGVSMLVPEKHYQQISNYINQRRLSDNRNKGMRFEYFRVPHSFKSSRYNEVDADSVVNKIEIKGDSPFESWLESELQKRYNLLCVSLEEFQRMPADVITKQGQYKVGNQRHIKDDRRELWDRRNFVLGWSNQEKIKAVEKHLNQLRIEKGTIEHKLKELTTENKNNTAYQGKLAQLVAYQNWQELNWKDEVDAIVELEKERNLLQNSNDLLKTLQENLLVVQQEIADQEKLLKEKLGDERSLQDKVSQYKEEITACFVTVNTLNEKEKERFYPKIAREIKDVPTP